MIRHYSSVLLILIFLVNAPLSAKQSSNLPRNFKGKIIYVGSVEAILTSYSPTDSLNKPNQSISSKSNLQNVSRSQGNYYTEIEYNGRYLKGRYFIPEAPEVSTDFTGFRHGEFCILFDGNNNQFISQCSLNEFVSELVYWDDQGKVYELYIQARSVD